MGAREKSVCVLYSWTLFLFLSLPNLCVTINNITPSSLLSQGQSLVSPNKIYELGFFTPVGSGNQYLGIWYHKISPQTVVWVANRENPLATDSLASLRIGRDGNLKLMDRNKTSVWSTNVSVKMSDLIALLLDSGNLVIQDKISGQNLWESFDHPCDTVISGMKIGLNSVIGEKQFITSWKSETDPSPGSFVLGITADTPSECFIWKGGAPYWRGGQWDKSTFIGQPTLSQSYLNGFDLQQDVQRGTAYLYVDIYNKSSLAHLVLTPKGSLRLVVLDKGKNQWTVSLETSMSRCDMYGVCGPFGVCRETSSPICKCLKGFVPNSEEEWGRGNWTRGCVRRTPLHCEESSTKKRDVFQKMTYIKLPDFSQYVPVPDEQACQSSCLKNCSCKAYAYVTAIGCMLWTRDLMDMQQFSFPGKDLFIRLSHSEIDEEKQHKTLSISLTTVAALILILGTLACGLRRLRFINQRGNMTGARRHSFFSGKFLSSRDSRHEDWRSHFSQQDQSELPMFDFSSILLATNEFSIGNKLGQGGFGPVYKGELKDGTYIAVKRLSSSSGQGIEEFKNEIILISKLQHRNLVRLLGCCIEGEEKLLIYEYMPNKSLDMFLFDPSKRHQLDWGRRFDIIEGVARGLLYLHRDSCLKVIHRDLKVSNILLDEKMNPKISDFGLARIFEGTQDLANTHRVVGTLGYMAPEYAIGGIFSDKSDVFSFGVLLLEIVSGKKNTGFLHHGQQINLIAYAWELWTEKRELDLVDESLSKSFCPSQVTRCIRVGLLCVQDQPADRPSMPVVLPMLCCEIECPKPKEPTLTFKKSSTSWDYYDHLLETSRLHTINNVTVTMVQGSVVEKSQLANIGT